jgi:hypothetical protein
MPLILRRELDNKFDKNAIAIWIRAKVLYIFSSEVKIGYINSDLARDVAQWIDAGCRVSAKITEVTGGTKDKTSLGVNILLKKA